MLIANRVPVLAIPKLETSATSAGRLKITTVDDQHPVQLATSLPNLQHLFQEPRRG